MVLKWLTAFACGLLCTCKGKYTADINIYHQWVSRVVLGTTILTGNILQSDLERPMSNWLNIKFAFL